MIVNEAVKPFGHLNTYKEAGKKLNVHARTVCRLVERGELPVIRVTQCSLRITDRAIDDFIAAKVAAAR
jgi:excisionase family DNA binding protein